MIGYENLGVVVRTRRLVVSRAVRRSDGARVLLKDATDDAGGGAGVLAREFELLRRLPVRGVARPVEVVAASGREWLVLDDQGLAPLAGRLRGPASLDVVFPIATALCDVLAELHARDLVIGTISPHTIFVDERGTMAALMDLSLAQRLPVDVQGLAVAVLDPATAAYTAPEQTGRISRTVDHRADLYAFGATLYHLLTGRRPFESDDPLELVHSHIARVPRPPHAIVAAIPEPVSRIVLRLLGKAAEDRYQSALGLRHDLEICWQQWRERGTIDALELGTRDVSDRLLIPQRLYGREAALVELTAAFEDTLEGRPGLLVVGGYAGVGKTSFINELCRPIVRERGYFVSGKFDQVARNMPYGALVQAFRGLVWQVLAASEEQLARCRAGLSEALGVNGGVVAAVIPEIEFIIGRQPPPAPLEAVESQNRFRYVFRRFVATLARPEHPLVVFLDDLQWADAATLELLQPILTDADPLSLLVIGAYRDNEVAPDHPLSLALDRLDRAAARVHRLTLGPLGADSLSAFLGDALRSPAADVSGLAALIREKTDGNPFFVIQFLQILQQERLLTFDRRAGSWTYQLEAIAAAATTDNVVTLMTQRIRRLSPAAQDVLRLAACIGSPFQWTTFLTATGVPRERAEAGLDEALTAALVRPAESQYDAAARATGRGAYAFIHDRVQQAAYALISEAERPGVHLEVGRQLLAECGAEIPEDRLFAIVNHLNLGAALIQDGGERLALARLNLAAARKAKASAAYDAAVGYLTAALDGTSIASWSNEYPLLFALHFERAECLYLAGAFAAAADTHTILLERAATVLDRAAVHELRITFYENRSRYGEAISSGRDGLALFGIALPETEAAAAAALDAELDAIRVRLAGRPIESLIALPVMDDVRVRTAMRILTLMWASVYISGNQRLTGLISATMVRLSLDHGNTEDSAYGYVTHAITVGPVRRQFADASAWGDLAIAVNERFGDVKRRAKVHQQVHAHVKLWRHAFAACVPHAREATRAGLEAGDFAYAGYGAATESWPAFMAAPDLARYVTEYTPALAFLDRVNMSGFRDALRVMLNWALALQGRTAGPVSLANGDLDEAAFIARYEATAPLFMTVLRCAHLHLAVVFDERAFGLEAVARAREVTIPGTMWPVLEEFWGALALAAACDDATPAERQSYRERIAGGRASLDELAANCPENFRCPALLVAAADVVTGSGLTTAARTLFEQAIDYAAATGNVQHEALASDLFGRALVQAGDEAGARRALARAYDAYGRWGAAAKQRHLRQRYPQLSMPTEPLPSVPPVSPVQPPALAALDVQSVLKVAQAVAGEIELDGLLRTVLTVAIENAGAERGVFLQVRDGDVVPVITARATNERVDVHPADPDDVGPLAQAVTRYVRRTRQDVVIGDPSRDERFSSHAPAAQDPRSILCVPVAHHGRVTGILYLDHRLSGAFTATRTEIVRVLAAQAAIAFDNAQLYAETKAEVDRRAAAETALRDALAEVQSLKNRLEAENVYLQEEIGTQHNFNEIVGHAPPLLEALRRVERVAPTDSTVLILGETGSGKELFARAVHSRSRRTGRPLVKVNCGAIAPGLVESELFGHVKGAFTGAIDKRVGRFELANGGTIFLDEIGELPLDAQVKLLRVLQEQEFEPVGSSRTVHVSVRVIAATNRNLEHAVRDGRFRTDLLYRLNVFPIEIPPLRERVVDIPVLVGFFLSRIARTLGKPLHGVTARSMEQIQRYAWPGNVRELQNVLERAAILAEGPIVDVSAALADREPAPASPASTAAAGNLDEVQRDHILSVLAATGGVVEGARGAAVILGVHPNTLRSRMKKLGISTRSLRT